jgi:hypothetical protein
MTVLRDLPFAAWRARLAIPHEKFFGLDGLGVLPLSGPKPRGQ